MHRPPTLAAPLFNKVPTITLSFWIIKVLSTTVGETGADYLAVHAGLGTLFTGVTMAVCLALALMAQVGLTRFAPWVYWLTVLLVSVAGTQITDALTDGLGVSLYLSTAVFALLLALVFGLWYRRDGTLSIHTIVTRRREAYYWSAILLTFALGTAAGDLATEELGLGFRLGVLLFGGMIALALIAYRRGANAVLMFWLAYILTRPLGAPLGDFLAQSPEYGGVGLGTVSTSILFLAAITALVAMVSRHAGHLAARPR